MVEQQGNTKANTTYIIHKGCCAKSQFLRFDSVPFTPLECKSAKEVLSMKTLIKAFNSFEEAEAWEISYWNSQIPLARLRAAEKLRRQLYGKPPKELPRILTMAQWTKSGKQIIKPQ